MKTSLQLLLAGLLGLAMVPAWALGLGQLVIKSKPGQPLVAEIPIISVDETELQGLQVRLASSDTFQRVGLPAPQGLINQLRFTPAVDDAGRPVIRITSAQPVEMASLNFLVEVDWGQGRLVREYSALLDAPRSVAAPVPPPVTAPVIAPSNTIVREPAVTATPLPPASTTTSTTAAPAAASPTPAPQPITIDVAPTPAPSVASVTPPPSAIPPLSQNSAQYGPIKHGETPGAIAAQLATAPGISRNQTLLALLQANPDAFIGGNVNLIREGAVLRVPDAEEQGRIDADAATAQLHAATSSWRARRKPQPQPAATADENTQTASAPRKTKPAPVAAPVARRSQQARLEIAPAASGAGKKAGTRSGIAAGGEGDMLRQELTQTKEALAARDAEVVELKARVAELEQLQQQQQQLITMKDSALAAAQRNAAQVNAQPAQPAVAKPAPQAAHTAQAEPKPQAPAAGSGLWIWLLPLLAALIGLAWWLNRRRNGAPPPAAKRSAEPSKASSLAASAPAWLGARGEEPKNGKPEPPRNVTVFATPESVPAPAAPKAPPAPAPAPEPVPAKPAPVAAKPASPISPTWHGNEPSAPAPASASAQMRKPQDDAAPTVPGMTPSERLNLARSYLELGDHDIARTLLREVMEGNDPAAREQAARLLASGA